jgi:hypothetical protein
VTPVARRSLRLFLTVWLVYGAFLTTNVVRETYLAVAIAEDQSVRVDRFLGLHPDLFEIPGRGGYINSNPGASVLGAVPWFVAQPAVAALFSWKPSLGAPKPPTTYDDPRPNRTRFMNEMRARGLDIRLALAAMVTQLGLMAPLAALMVVLLHRYLLARGHEGREALTLTLLYAFATPLLFRSAFLNQNALLAHAILGAWLLLTWPRRDGAIPRHASRWWWAGLLLGTGMFLDYSAAPLAVVFGCWALQQGWVEGGLRVAMVRATSYTLGAAGPIALLFAYQWVAFGVPWYPAQRYMPATDLSVHGWNGVALPTFDLLWRNLADPRYGLFAFAPLLLLALAAPWTWRRERDGARDTLVVALAAPAALWLFSSANQFAALQWNTGVRYLIPAVPLLFVAAIATWRAAPRWLRWGVAVPSAVISFAVSMMREDVPTSLGMLVERGPLLPLLVVLEKTAGAYAPWLATGGVQPLGLLAVLLVAGAVFAVWRVGRERRPSA